jgi:hypothetical protein
MTGILKEAVALNHKLGTGNLKVSVFLRKEF